MFESIAGRLSALVNKLRFKRALTERNIEEACEEVRSALLEADVAYGVVREFLRKVRERAVGEEVTKNVEPSQQFVKIIYDEMVELLGGGGQALIASQKPPTIIMTAGLQGSGKTTTCAKLARFFMKKGSSPLLVAADVKRPAAVEQLKVLGEQIGVPVHSEDGTSPPLICSHAVERARLSGSDIIILDTAGRLHIDGEMMEELVEVTGRTSPHEILLVADATTGQDAVNSARAFNERLEVTGIVLTKLDGDARGGAALSIKSVTGKPIKLVGVGEKLDALEEFRPDGMASRILGMGDVVSLVERAQEAMDKETAVEMRRKLLEADFTLEDMLKQFDAVKKMGSLGDLVSMIPGLSSAFPQEKLDEREFVRFEAIIKSMTGDERQRPDTVDFSRRKRIAAGSGTSPQDVSSLLKQYREMKKMFMGKGKLLKTLAGAVPNLEMFGIGQKKRAAPDWKKVRKDRKAKKRERRKQKRRRR